MHEIAAIWLDVTLEAIEPRNSVGVIAGPAAELEPRTEPQ